MLWRLLLLLHCCCCNALPAEDCSEEFRWLGNLFQLHVTALYNAQCWLRWEILRDFKTKWETNSDYIGTSSLWYGSFLQERPKISFIFQVDFWVEVQNFLTFTFLSYSNYGAIFSSRDSFVEPLFSERQLGPLILVTKALSNSFTFSEVIHRWVKLKRFTFFYAEETL